MFFETATHDPRGERARRRFFLALGALAVIAAAGLMVLDLAGGFVWFGHDGANEAAREPPLSQFIPPRQQLAELEIEPVRLGIFHDGEEPAHSAPAIPAKAVMHAGDTARVWVAGSDGSLALRDVVLGEASGDRVEVTRGLAAGEKIVTNGGRFTDRP